MSTQRSLQELTERAQSILNTHTGQHNPAINALASTIAGISYGQYGYQDLLFNKVMVTLRPIRLAFSFQTDTLSDFMWPSSASQLSASS